MRELPPFAIAVAAESSRCMFAAALFHSAISCLFPQLHSLLAQSTSDAQLALRRITAVQLGGDRAAGAPRQPSAPPGGRGAAAAAPAAAAAGAGAGAGAASGGASAAHSAAGEGMTASGAALMAADAARRAASLDARTTSSRRVAASDAEPAASASGAAAGGAPHPQGGQPLAFRGMAVPSRVRSFFTRSPGAALAAAAAAAASPPGEGDPPPPRAFAPAIRPGFLLAEPQRQQQPRQPAQHQAEGLDAVDDPMVM